PPPRTLPGVPGLRDGLPVGGAVRQDHRLLQAHDGRPASCGADPESAATVDALSPDALRPPDAFGGGAAPPIATGRVGRGGSKDGSLPAAVAAAHARDRADAAAAPRLSAGIAAGRRETAGAGGTVPWLCSRRLLPANELGHCSSAPEERLRRLDPAGSGLL